MPKALQPARSRAIVPAIVCLLALAGNPVEAAEYKTRDAGPTEEQMIARSDGGLPGLAFVRPVLNGVLYRAGFKGGDGSHTGLSADQRLALCDAGFSGARYVDFGSKTAFGTTACDGNSLDYQKALSGNTTELMKDLHAVIQSPDKGPILVHCMWGVHSSGAVSAMALVQFCGWTEERAKSYWHRARNNAPCGSAGCDTWIDDKFARFRIDPNLEISEEQRAAICPQ